MGPILAYFKVWEGSVELKSHNMKNKIDISLFRRLHYYDILYGLTSEVELYAKKGSVE